MCRAQALQGLNNGDRFRNYKRIPNESYSCRKRNSFCLRNVMRKIQYTNESDSYDGSESEDRNSAEFDAWADTGLKDKSLNKIVAANKKVRLYSILKNYNIPIVKSYATQTWSNLIQCPLPSHKDRTASFGYNFRNDYFNCLAAETKVITKYGVRKISDLVGETHKVLGLSCTWVDGVFKSYGKQKLYKISLTRNRQKKIIYATAGHRWFIRKRKNEYKKEEVITLDLKANVRLASCFTASHINQMKLSPFGIAHGITFGDGTANEKYGFAYLIGEKDSELKKWFPLNHTTIDKSRPDKTIIHQVPRSFKRLPLIDDTPAYLYGWLAGYFAADGCIAKDGTMALDSAKKENLEFVRDICNKIGIITYGVTGRERIGFGKKSYIYTLHFSNESFTSDFFLISKHRERFESSNKKYSRLSWTVKSVEETDRFEEVYCAEVEHGNAFTLEDNILTGNCLGCKRSGKAVEFIAAKEEKPKISIAESILEHYSDSEVQDVVEDEREDPRVQDLLFKMSEIFRESIISCREDAIKIKNIEKIIWWFDMYIAIKAGARNNCRSQNLDVEELEARVFKAQELLNKIIS